MAKRTLALKRDVLQDLTTDELRDVAGGVTQFSCLAYISCFITACLPTLKDQCID